VAPAAAMILSEDAIAEWQAIGVLRGDNNVFNLVSLLEISISCSSVVLSFRSDTFRSSFSLNRSSFSELIYPDFTN
jgi:hypothetical protein